jgi:hypothetical protein
MMGGALGLAVLAGVAASRTSHLVSSGQSQIAALNAGYHTAFLIGALFAIVAATLGALLLQTKATAPVADHASAMPADGPLADATL